MSISKKFLDETFSKIIINKKTVKFNIPNIMDVLNKRITIKKLISNPS